MRRTVMATAIVAVTTAAGLAAVPSVAFADVGSLPAGTGEARSATFASFSVSAEVRARVDVGSGNLLLQTSELSLPGISANVTLGAVYNSLLVGTSAPTASMGAGWRDRSGADTRLSVNTDQSVTYVAPDGDTGVFQPASGGGYTTPSEFRATLTKNSDGTWKLSEHAGDVLSFNTDGRLTKITDRNGQASTFAYSSGKQATITSTRGTTAARTVTVGYTGSAISSYAQTAGGTTRTATYHQDASGNLTSIVNPAGHTTTIAYNAAGLVSSLTTGAAGRTAFTYDSSNQVTAVTQYATAAPSLTSVTRLSYPSATQTLLADANTDQTQAVSAVAHTTYTVDSAKRITKAVDPAGNTRSDSFSPLGDVATSTDADSNVSTNTWGSNGGESLTKSASATGSSQAMAYTNTATSANPSAAYQPSGSTDAQGNASAFTYDGPGNLSANTDASAAQAKVDHNSDGTIKSSTDPHNGTNSTTYGYDTNHQLTTVTPVTGSSLGARTLTYDAFGRLSTATDGAGHTTTWTYYLDDQVKTVAYTDATPTVSYVYDDAGNMTTRTDRTGATTWTYDYRNQMTSRTSASGGGTLTYTYDKVGNLATTVDASGTTTDEYNTRNLLVRQTDPAGHLYRFFYDDNGRRTNTYFNSNADSTVWAAKTSLDYDHSGRIQRVKTLRDSTTSTVVSDISYCYAKHVAGQNCSTATTDDTGLRQWQIDNTTGDISVFSYDTSNRLTKATNYHGHTYSYGYDSNGNRTTTTIDSTTTNPTFNAANQTTTSGETYDGAGNQTHASLGTLGYNAAQQMTSGPSGYYTYAGTTQNELTAGPAGHYVWGHPDTTGNPWLQSATINNQAVYLDHDNNGTPLGLQIAATDYTYVTDGQGSILGLVAADGSLAATYTYDPYGTQTATTGGTTATTNPLGYTGGLRDTTSLLKLGQRWYNPAQGRFTQQDGTSVLGDPSRGNRYAYASDNAVNYTDPTGMCSSGEYIVDGAAVIGGALAVAGGILTSEFGVGILAATSGVIVGSAGLVDFAQCWSEDTGN